jgi:hypothetical protein
VRWLRVEPIQAKREGQDMSTTYDSQRCWAFSLSGDRCQAEASHDGLHFTQLSWDDNECYDPSMVVLAPVLDVPYLAETPTMPPEAAQDGPGTPGPLCVVCDHPPHEPDGCTGRGPMGQCDCRRYV